MGSLERAERRSVILWAAVTLAVQVTYANWAYGFCVDLFFHFDDFWAIGGASKLDIHTPLDFWQFFKPNNGFLLYRPISMVAYFWGLRELFGYDSRYYHMVQIGLVVVNSMLVFGVVQRLTQRPLVAALCSVVYGLAPGHAIAACWNSLATAVLTATFYFAAVLRWLGPPRRRTVTTFFWFFLALCSSEHGVTLPATLLLLSLTALPADRRAVDTRALLPFIAIAAFYLIAKIVYLRFFLWYDFPSPFAQAFISKEYATSLDPQVILTNLGYYVTYMFGPLYQMLPSDAAALYLGIAVLAAAAVAVVWGVWSGDPSSAPSLLALGMGMFVIGVAPVLPLVLHRYSYYISIPGLGAAIALSALGRRRAWVNLAIAGGFAVWFATVQLNGGLERVEASGEFAFLRSFSFSALRWVHTAYEATRERPVETVYVHEEGVTGLVFTSGLMHKLVLCADYDVKVVPATEALPAESATSLNLPDTTEPLAESSDRRWMHLRGCPTK